MLYVRACDLYIERNEHAEETLVFALDTHKWMTIIGNLYNTSKVNRFKMSNNEVIINRYLETFIIMKIKVLLLIDYEFLLSDWKSIAYYIQILVGSVVRLLPYVTHFNSFKFLDNKNKK